MAKEKTKVQTSKDEAQRILDRVANDTDSLGTSSMARTASRISDHFSAADAPQDDPVEVLGKRIGRVLSLIVFIILAIYLVNTYVLN